MGTCKLAILACIHALCLYLFCTGFLLTRIELPNVSPCRLETSIAPGRQVSGCWSDARFEKVVLLVVDALRFDFVLADREPNAPHVQKFPKLLSLLQDSGEAGLLMKLKADPPTNTVQRIKAMLTGSLPTFLDVGTAFAAATVTEDSLLSQLKSRGAKLAFVGDDTWEQLFPDFFDISIPYPSFDVHDLHTVDDGVWEHLPPLILNATNKWNLIIGHYLGVDHAGHTFGVRTPEMMEKLSQMDDQISTLVNMLIDAANFNQEHSDTLVLVFGDHGQNLNGDHGGGTWEETESALLAFDVGSIRSMREHRRVAFPPGNLGYASDRPTCSMISELDQLDFASNLAMMLGIPIPFGNVGKISSVFWKFAFKSDNNMLLEALRINSWQVNHYITQYAAKAGIHPKSLDRLNQLYEAIVAGSDNLIHCYLRYLNEVASFAREQWTQFKLDWMLLGILLLVAALAYQVCMITSMFGPPSSTSEKFLWGVCFCHGVSMLSNSYVIAEGRMLAFWLSTTVLISIYAAPPKTKCSRKSVASFSTDESMPQEPKNMVLCSSTKRYLPSVFHGLCFLILTIALESFGLADRTGGNPFDKTRLVPVELEASELLQQCLMHIPLVIMALVLTASHRPGRTCQVSILNFLNLVGHFLMWTEFSLVSGWRLIQDVDLWMGKSMSSILPFRTPYSIRIVDPVLNLRFDLLLPRLVYCVAIISILLFAVLVFSSSGLDDREGRITRRQVQQSVIGCLVGLVVLLLGRRGTLLGGIVVVRTVCFIRIMQHAELSPVAFGGMWWMLSMHVFFGTGHYCEFSGLDFAAAFTGLEGFHLFYSGVLLAINTFGPYCLGVVAMVLIATNLEENQRALHSNNGLEKGSGSSKFSGVKVRQVPKSKKMSGGIRFQGILLSLLTIQTFLTLMCMIGAAIHRRHLLIWTVFAPKFVFSALFLIITGLLVCILGVLQRRL